LLVQKQIIPQQKGLILSYLELDILGCGIIKRAPRPLAAKRH
jgi:hypothetical protein